jgi:hypothetical protein
MTSKNPFVHTDAKMWNSAARTAMSVLRKPHLKRKRARVTWVDALAMSPSE